MHMRPTRCTSVECWPRMLSKRRLFATEVEASMAGLFTCMSLTLQHSGGAGLRCHPVYQGRRCHRPIIFATYWWEPSGCPPSSRGHGLPLHALSEVEDLGTQHERPTLPTSHSFRDPTALSRATTPEEADNRRHCKRPHAPTCELLVTIQPQVDLFIMQALEADQAANTLARAARQLRNITDLAIGIL
eukprot:48377-Amphidinium_carterae.2